ncbi:inositol monophosphatase [Brevundimonas sp. Leaf363]|uniref:histidinol-phosphatase n=1 Tax=Brevundimonas sp. Leaf363 TaxID=1736353 RepID=UPI0006F6A6B2|nr:histidinol-phosphatase [Brevundimonas sp. Leaf363]KQS57507.1 inositol monophosphatase [Brevundimonas sp. Leaf363]
MTELEAFCVELAAAAAAVTVPLFRTDCGEENKAERGFDPVTEADKGAEAAIRKLIGARYPDHGVIGEEYGEDRPDAEHVWVLDPVDGTRAFISGLPLWTTLIGLKVAGKPTIGAIAQPYIGELFLGGPSGAVLMARGETTPIRTRSCPRLTDAVISTTDPEIFNGAELGAWTQVRATARLARLGCDAYAYAMVAQGTMDLVAETSLKEWDWTALIPVIEAAGGKVTDWSGGAPSGDGRILAVGDAALTEQALVTLKRAAI